MGFEKLWASSEISGRPLGEAGLAAAEAVADLPLGGWRRA